MDQFVLLRSCEKHTITLEYLERECTSFWPYWNPSNVVPDGCVRLAHNLGHRDHIAWHKSNGSSNFTIDDVVKSSFWVISLMTIKIHHIAHLISSGNGDALFCMNWNNELNKLWVFHSLSVVFFLVAVVLMVVSDQVYHHHQTSERDVWTHLCVDIWLIYEKDGELLPGNRQRRHCPSTGNI